MEFYKYNGVEYIPRSLVNKCLCGFEKLKNGRYYVSVDDFLSGRTKYYNEKFRILVHKLLDKKNDFKKGGKTWFMVSFTESGARA